MSEEEAIDILTNEVADIVIGNYCTHCEICENEDMECRYIKAIDTILDLYNKQKEEIEELKKPKFILNAETGTVTKIHNDFISKDKIREKIKELEEKEKNCNFTGLITECEIKIETLKELLED